MSTIINATTTNGVVIQPDNSGSLVLQTNSGTTALTIDTSQNIGIGTTSPLAKLSVSGGITATGQFSPYNGATLLGYIGNDNSISGGTGTNLGIRSDTAINFATGGATERMRIDSSGNLLFNSGYGSVATAYGCRAWVKFNGTGTVAINGSGNVTSITDNGTGDYTINITTALSDTNYTVVLGNNYNGTGAFSVINPNTPIYSTTQVKLQIVDRNGSAQDTSIINAAIFR